jgi:tetratricopeptide (TPR) repeat protein
MESKVISSKQYTIVELILNNQLGSAFGELTEIAYASRQGELITSLENLEQTYQSVLKYSFGYAKDPERNKIFASLKRNLIELTDDIAEHLKESSDEWLLLLQRNGNKLFGCNEQEMGSIVDRMAIEKEFDALLDETNTKTEKSDQSPCDYNSSLADIFDVLWLTNNYGAGEKEMAIRLFNSKNIPWHDKALIVSAIILSGLRHFDHTKVELLFHIYNLSENQIYQRALTGLFLILLTYESRINLYPEIENRIKSIEDSDLFARRFEQVILQYIRAQETEKVTAKVQNEIIPEVMKLRPEIEEKLRLDEIINKENQEDKNPDWEKFFGDTPNVYKKLEEFSNMQMDGSDVLMGAFSMLKRFGFFEKFTNWFLPFYKNHPEITKSIKGVASENYDWNTFFEGIEQAPVMCNSDKYSFAFNLGFMPDMQKSMMLDLFNSELQQMKEVAEVENKHNSTAVDKMVFAQYLQDLYRFYKLHPKRDSFKDIFRLDLSVEKSKFLSQIFTEKHYRNIAEFYFQKDYFQKAIDLFGLIPPENQSFEVLEKTGFCYQKLNQFYQAIELYKRAEILDTKRIWLHRKLGYCYRSLGEFDKAIEHYKKVEYAEPDNLEVQAFLGQLYIDKEDYEIALKFYFKVEYLKPDLIKVQRPIAWCNFRLNKTEQALHYFKKVTDTEGKRADYLNLGHCYWVTGNLSEAMESYRMAIKLSGNNIQWFKTALLKDAIYLKGYGIDELDVTLMADYLTFRPE